MGYFEKKRFKNIFKGKKFPPAETRNINISEYLKQLKNLVFPLIQYHQDANTYSPNKAKGYNITNEYSMSLIFPIYFFLPISNRDMMLLPTEMPSYSIKYSAFYREQKVLSKIQEVKKSIAQELSNN